MSNKKIIVCLLLSFSYLMSYAQYALNSEFSNGNMDNNISIMLEKTHRRNSFSAGLKIHIKTPYLDDGQRHAFYRNSYATSFGDFIGAKIGYERRLSPNKWKVLSFVAFGNSYFSRMQTQRITYYRDSFEIFKRTNFLETNFGLGMKLKVIEPVYFTFKVGGGMVLIWDFDDSFKFHGGNNWTWEFSRLFSAGISVKLP